MKALLRLILMMMALFASIFVVLKLTGAFTADDIRRWLTDAQQLSPWTVGPLVVALLVADLLLSIPTITTALLAGFFLGHAVGALAVGAGLILAGCLGYVLGRTVGEPVVAIVLRDEADREEAREAFARHGLAMIVFARAMPMLPETSACLAGMTRMPFSRFFAAWCLNSIPYALISTYAGSVSTIDDPRPALFTGVGLFAIFWALGYARHWHHKRAPSE